MGHPGFAVGWGMGTGALRLVGDGYRGFFAGLG